MDEYGCCVVWGVVWLGDEVLDVGVVTFAWEYWVAEACLLQKNNIEPLGFREGDELGYIRGVF